tara:strand:- start:6103 stop:7128 length:1026 start_codon:yes stop_codon:yes gene_type:complete
MSSTTKCVIRIDENGPRVESNGSVVAHDLKLTLKDYLPTVTNWTTWNGILNEGDEINISTPYKFIAVRARNAGTSTGSTINGNIDLVSACLPANNSLASNCGCSDDTISSDEVILDFEMNQYTTYDLSLDTLYSDNEYVFDCTNGATATGVTGWIGCTGCTGATGYTGPAGATGATCGLETNAPVKGVYGFAFVGVMRDNKFILKTDDAENNYKCGLEYHAYVKQDNNKIVFVFDDTHGKWVIVRLDENLNDIIKNIIGYNVIELIEWSETNENYKDSNISIPTSIGYTGTNTYDGSISELDENMPVEFKMNSLFIMESKTFMGTITSRVNNLDVNVMLAI